MPNYKTPVPSRKKAFDRQQGRCYYCSYPIWLADPDSFKSTHGLTKAQAKLFQCTAEHLTPRSEGGSDALGNVAAACWYCNWQRHRRAAKIEPNAFRDHVRKRVSAGRWHSALLKALPTG
jgi:5-methylcytosine-specific restriction endonuclease McrA